MKAPPLPWRSAVDLVTPDERRTLWRRGKLFWTLHGDQARVYAEYRRWDENPWDREGRYQRVFVFDCSRRWGKDWLSLVIKLEDAIRRPGSVHTYGTAFKTDINDIVLPLLEMLLELDCPEDIRPRYMGNKQGLPPGLYFPEPIGSAIKLVGIDKNPDGLRGRGSDGVVLTEAAYIKKLSHTVRKVLYPQFQGRPHARLILQSTAPQSPNTDYDVEFVRDAKRRRAWAFRTIDDNPLLSDGERKEFVEAAGGKQSDTAQNEYYNQRIRDAKKALVPEFNRARHVRKRIVAPPWADTYTSGDPGMRDLFGLIWGFWDPMRGKLCIQRAWAQRNAGTSLVATVWRGMELQLWGGDIPVHFGAKQLADYNEATRQDLRTWAQALPLGPVQWYDGTDIRQAPYLRYSDTDIRFLGDLSTDHSMEVQCVDKSYSVEASLYYLRDWFKNDLIEIDEEGAWELIEHLEEGVWNEHRTDYERSEKYGHFDLISCLRYLVRHVDRERDPKPPDHVLNPQVHAPVLGGQSSPQAETLNATIAKRLPWQGDRRKW